MRLLITGGAGYIGSIITEQAIKKEHRVSVIDNLSHGNRAAVSAKAEFILGDICSRESLEGVFSSHSFDAVIHLAAESTIDNSDKNPQQFYHTNVLGGLNLLDAMLKHKVSKIIFSSTAAVYGQPEYIPIDEQHPSKPISTYGESKLMFENILQRYKHAYGLKYIIFRYFNAAGANKNLGEFHHPETHLIPKILNSLLEKEGNIPIYGTDYPTLDGSCIRDFVHVLDIAQAHLLALDKIDNLQNNTFNLGSEEGYSVLQVINTAEKITGNQIAVKKSPRRPGDPAVLVADSKLAKKDLGWGLQFPSLDDIIDSTWRWLRTHPNGYN